MEEKVCVLTKLRQIRLRRKLAFPNKVKETGCLLQFSVKVSVQFSIPCCNYFTCPSVSDSGGHVAIALFKNVPVEHLMLILQDNKQQGR